MKSAFHEFIYLCIIIFSIGPIRLFLKIKEGKLSVEQIVEDY
jgi:hypothetical protein